MVTVALKQQNNLCDEVVNNNEEEDENGVDRRSIIDNERLEIGGGVTIIREVDEEASDSAGSSSLEDRGYATDATTSATVSVRRESDIIRRIDEEDVSHNSSTQYSDVDDSLDGDDHGSWSNDLNAPVSLEQHFDNGVSLPISEVPNFGDVCVKNSSNVHFGNKTFYNGPVTIKQIVYPNHNLIQDDNNHHLNNDYIDDAGEKISKYSSHSASPKFNDNSSHGNDVKTAKGSRNSEDEFKVTHWCAWLLTWRCVALMCAMGSCLVASVVVSVVLLSRNSETPPGLDLPEIPESNVDGVTSKLRFIERPEWGAEPPREPLTKLKHPVPYVIISHTATDFCKSQAECTFRVRFAQTFHIESRNWSDIAYNFLVGGDGYAYVGRSWENVGAHSYGYNIKSIGISFIGTFNTVTPPDKQLLAAQQLIEYGVDAGKIASDYKLLAHRQISATLSPGDALYKIITTWPHWSPKP